MALHKKESGKNMEQNSIEIINMTPHKINLYSGDYITVYPSRGQIRCEQSLKKVSNIVFNGTKRASIPIYKIVYGNVDGLPKEKAGIFYIVSNLVAQQCKYRKDLLFPVDFVRQDGVIVGCKGFGRL